MERSTPSNLYKQRAKFTESQSRMQGGGTTLSRFTKLLVGATLLVFIFFYVFSANNTSVQGVLDKNVAVTGGQNAKVNPNGQVQELPGKGSSESQPQAQDKPTTPNESNQLKETTKEQTAKVEDDKNNNVVGKESTKYVIMIDAGSSGSRVHVYSFDVSQGSPKLLDEKFEMLKPGLSSFADDPAAAAKSLDPLMKVALESVPVKDQKCTPVAVKATAGLRMTGEETAKKILAAVRSHLENDYPFPVVEGDAGVGVMEGKDEGVYAWITANYLLDNLSKTSKSTAAVFDLGGGSTQIVFEPSQQDVKELAQEIKDQPSPQADHMYTLKFGGREFELYQHSHLLYGLNEAANLINALILDNYLKAHDTTKTPTELINPCLPPGTSKMGRKVRSGDKTYAIDMVAPKEHSEVQCRALAETILNKHGDCKVEPCSFNGVYQPSLVDSFLPTNDMYIFSYFYDRTQPLGMPESFNLHELKDLTSKVCRGKEMHSSFAAFPDAIDELEKHPEWCLELNFMVALLHTGYDIPGHREVKIAKKIKNRELGWCLGASLPLLEGSGWTCRVDVDSAAGTK